MYTGVDAETATGNAAVTATAGKVVEYGGRPVVTYFFSSSGGHTESVQNVWYNFAPAPWLRGVPDPYDDSYGNPYYRWTASYTLAAAASKVRSLYKGTLEGIKITQTGVSPRVVRAQVVGTEGASTVTGFQLERLFGTRSTYMSFTTLNEKGERTKTTTPSPSGVVSKRASKPAKKVTIHFSVQGTVYPAKRGLFVTVQLWTGVGWRSVAHTRLAANGSYTILVKLPGTYRVASEGLDGPNIKVP
jgi:stage II sporulation protein D